MKIGVVGSGTMGSGIAQVAAMAGSTVLLYDTDKDALIRSQQKLEKILSRLVEKLKIADDEKTLIQERIHYIHKMDDLQPVHLVIEAIVEDLNIKTKLFQQLETVVSNDCILASNTSSLSITALAANCQYPERFIGIHFFNPAPLMKLVEIIPALQTNDACLKTTQSIVKDFRKKHAVAKDTPGFIVNRIARPFYSEALRIYEEGIANFSTIDAAMKEIGGFKMGPFELMDYIGNDVNYAVTSSVYKAFHFDTKYRPSFTQKNLVDANYLGRKTKKGFYQYADDGTKEEQEIDRSLLSSISQRIVIMLINDASLAVFWGIANIKDADKAMTLGVNYPKGLLKWADELGIEFCVQKMDELYEYYHEERYRCCPLMRKKSIENSTYYQL